MLSIVPLIIIILSLGTILIIASRHIKKATALDVSDIPEEREAILKKSILENRLLNKVDQIFRLLNNFIKPAQKIASGWLGKGLGGIKNLEKKYRFSGGLPDSSKKSESKAKDLLKEAQDDLQSGSLSRAESKYLSAIKVNPDFMDAYIGLGNTYIKMEEWDQARETFEHVTKTWPQDDKGFACLAELEGRKGNLGEAKDYLLHALSINNEIVDYHIDLAEVYLNLSDNEKALSSLQIAQGLEPNNPKILDQLFLVSVLLSNKHLAEEVLMKIKKQNSDHGRLQEFEKKVKALK
ncbi:tetratricopeptide repeat protein [Patescibacteria group bacterium]|nr:tetratricopeptide repeat protein [Patescibacteria group bacterium]